MKTPQGEAMEGMTPLGIKPKACEFQLWGMMPPCVLKPGHTEEHTDGFGGYYGTPKAHAETRP